MCGQIPLVLRKSVFSACPRSTSEQAADPCRRKAGGTASLACNAVLQIALLAGNIVFPSVSTLPPDDLAPAGDRSERVSHSLRGGFER